MFLALILTERVEKCKGKITKIEVPREGLELST